MLLNKSKKQYLRIRYEDFIQNPKNTTNSILTLIQEETANLPFESNLTVKMSTDHLFTGSPSSRSRTGSVKLQLDERWKTNMKLIDRTTTMGLTWLLMKRYGYL